jgi:hypothetical protein
MIFLELISLKPLVAGKRSGLSVDKYLICIPLKGEYIFLKQ